MANTVSLLSYTNTFGDWMVATNNLAKENNDLAANNYIKPTGTLYLNSSTLGLQVANNAIIAGQLQVQGIGSSAYVQNNLRVDTQVYFQNTILGLTNSGQANINGLLIAQGPGTGLYVANTANIGGMLNVVGATSLGNTLIVSKATTLSNTLTVTSDAGFSSNVNVSNYIHGFKDIIADGSFNAGGIVNSYGLNVIGNGAFTGQLSVNGNFVLNGATVYNTNKFEINANSIVGLTSYYNVNRGPSANAQIRWNEPSQYWDIRDVNNPTSYSEIVTANLISDSLTTINSGLIASSTAANTLNTWLSANVISLQSQISSNGSSFQGQLSSNVSNISGIDAAQNNSITIIQGVDVTQNTRLTIIEATDVTQNTRLTIIEATDVTQNTSIASTNGKMQNAYAQANTGSVLAQAGYNQANTGTVLAQAAFDTANNAGINASNLTSGTLPAARLPASGVSAQSYGDSINIPSVTVDATGRITSALNTVVRTGSTSQTGVLQLIDSTSSTSTTTAATPNSVKTTYDLATARAAINPGAPKTGDIQVSGSVISVYNGTSWLQIYPAIYS